MCSTRYLKPSLCQVSQDFPLYNGNADTKNPLFRKQLMCYNVVFFWSIARDGCRGLPLLPMEHPEIAHINFHSWVFVSKNGVNQILKLDRKLLDTIFLVVPFLTQFAILCNVLSVLASFPITNLNIFWVARYRLFWSHGF